MHTCFALMFPHAEAATARQVVVEAESIEASREDGTHYKPFGAIDGPEEYTQTRRHAHTR